MATVTHSVTARRYSSIAVKLYVWVESCDIQHEISHKCDASRNKSSTVSATNVALNFSIILSTSLYERLCE